MNQLKQPDASKPDRIVADARKSAEKREKGYREQALKIYSWVCSRCARTFIREAGPMNAGTTIIAFVADPDGYYIELIGKKS